MPPARGTPRREELGQEGSGEREAPTSGELEHVDEREPPAEADPLGPRHPVPQQPEPHRQIVPSAAATTPAAGPCPEPFPGLELLGGGGLLILGQFEAEMFGHPIRHPHPAPGSGAPPPSGVLELLGGEPGGAAGGSSGGSGKHIPPVNHVLPGGHEKHVGVISSRYVHR